MRSFYRLQAILLACFFLPYLASAQVYVNPGASGTNDGSTWTNAYTDLQTAIDSADAGSELWIIAGTYVPGDVATGFAIRQSLTLLGGFAGTETAVGERNPGANVTILSGDTNGDDAGGTGPTTDNTIHVVYVDSMISDIVTIDGFTISGGAASTDTLSPAPDRQGGGVFSYSPLELEGNTITQNSAAEGAGVYLSGLGASGSIAYGNDFNNNNAAELGGAYMFVGTGDVLFRRNTVSENSAVNGAGGFGGIIGEAIIDSCSFSDNTTGGDGAGVLLFDVFSVVDVCTFDDNTADLAGSAVWCAANTFVGQEMISVTNSEFSGNVANSTGNAGALHIAESDFVLVDNCNFDDNSSTRGAFYMLRTDTSTVSNCTFNENLGDRGAGLSIVAGFDVAVESCTFTDNSVTLIAGALYTAVATYSVNNSVFTGNSAASSGGVLYNINNPEDVSTITNCQFNSNEAPFGGAILMQDGQGFYTDCIFDSNECTNSGAGGLNGFGAVTTFERCEFKDNNSGGGGAGIRQQNDFTQMTVLDCSFTDNSSSSGTAILGTQGGAYVISNTIFQNNSSDGFGGALNIFEDSLDLTTLTVDRCQFIENLAVGQGGAMSIGNADATITNCIFDANFTNENPDDIAAGVPTGRGAISNNASTGGVSSLAKITFINNTFSNNEGVLGGLLVQWEQFDTLDNGDIISGEAEAVFMNNILFYDGLDSPHYGIEQGTPTVSSMGGNISVTDDTSLDTIFTQTRDQVLAPDAVGLESPDDGDLELLDDSPGVDNGIDMDAPTVDFDNNTRIDAFMPDGTDIGTPGVITDVGAYEREDLLITISTDEIVDATALTVSPNPVSTEANLFLDNDWRGKLELRLTNALGQVVYSDFIVKADDNMTYLLNTSDLANGVYRITLSNGDQTMVKSMVRNGFK